MRVSELPRPSPERLLKQVQAEESKRWGAKLKIFLGYAPGVGKSYRMLDEARRRHERPEIAQPWVQRLDMRNNLAKGSS